MNKKVYKIGKKGETNGEFAHSGTTEYDVTEKDITPVGGFPHYGIVNEDFIMLKVTAQNFAECSYRPLHLLCSAFLHPLCKQIF